MSSETIDDRPVTGDHETLRADLDAVVARLGLSQAALAARIGYSKATLSLWRSGTYTGDVEGVAEKVRRFLDSVRDASASRAGISAAPAFLMTSTARRIWAQLLEAQHAPGMVVISGVPGVGKTVTCREYARKMPNVWHATMDPTVVSPAQVLQEVARTMGITLGSPTTLRDRIGDKMAGTQGLLVIDEAQHANPKALDTLRALHDRYDVGVAFVGNYGLFAGTTAPNKTHNFAQFYRRVQSRSRITEPSDEDIETMLDAWSIEDEAERKFLAKICRKNWGLSGIQNTVRKADQLALGAGQPRTIEHMRAAWAGLNEGAV